MQFTPLNPDFAARVRDSFARQAAMRLIGAALTEVAPGRVAIELPVREELTQQHRYVHGGVVGMIADSAGGYAAFTLMPAGASVLTVEYKINMLAPATGERLVARGEVVPPPWGWEPPAAEDGGSPADGFARLEDRRIRLLGNPTGSVP